jgi:hypothetical protein
MVFQASIESATIFEMVTHNNSINLTPKKLRFLGCLRAARSGAGYVKRSATEDVNEPDRI